MWSFRPGQIPSEARESVRAYEARILELLESCADHQRHDPEVFLWNARRALEAICHLLLTVHRQRTSRAAPGGKDGSLDAMIKLLQKEGVLDQEQGPRFDLARSHTNLGVHIQKPEKEDYDAAVDDVAHVLPGILVWLYTESPAAPYLQRKEQLPTDTIRGGGRDGPSLKDAAGAARREREQAERTLNEVREQLVASQRLLGERETRWWRWGWRVVWTGGLGLMAGTCLGLGGAAAWPDGWTWSAPATRAAAHPEASVPAEGASLGPALLQDVASAVTAPAPADALPAPTCPVGMVLIPARTGMLLGQPEGGRQNWPPARSRRLDPVDVPAFCLDAEPRPRSTPPASGWSAAAVAECEKNVPAKDRPAARTCLTRDEAAAWCAAAVEGGYLAGIHEWESAARARRDAVEGVTGLQAPQQEWSGERFPPKPFLRADPGWSGGDGMWVGQIDPQRAPKAERGHVLLAWNQQAPDRRGEQRGFRCAAPAR